MAWHDGGSLSTIESTSVTIPLCNTGHAVHAGVHDVECEPARCPWMHPLHYLVTIAE